MRALSFVVKVSIFENWISIVDLFVRSKVDTPFINNLITNIGCLVIVDIWLHLGFSFINI